MSTLISQFFDPVIHAPLIYFPLVHWNYTSAVYSSFILSYFSLFAPFVQKSEEKKVRPFLKLFYYLPLDFYKFYVTIYTKHFVSNHSMRHIRV